MIVVLELRINVFLEWTTFRSLMKFYVTLLAYSNTHRGKQRSLFLLFHLSWLERRRDILLSVSHHGRLRFPIKKQALVGRDIIVVNLRSRTKHIVVLCCHVFLSLCDQILLKRALDYVLNRFFLLLDVLDHKALPLALSILLLFV